MRAHFFCFRGLILSFDIDSISGKILRMVQNSKWKDKYKPNANQQGDFNDNFNINVICQILKSV
jgi:hypothetical protein